MSLADAKIIALDDGEVAVTDVPERVAAESQRNIDPSAWVLRLLPRVAEQLVDPAFASVREELFERAGGRPVHVLTYATQPEQKQPSQSRTARLVACVRKLGGTRDPSGQATQHALPKPGDHVLRELRGNAYAAPSTRGEVTALAASDLSRIANGAPFGFYRESETHHYVAPSGAHCRSFFRLGDVIQSRRVLDTLAFWILPHVSRADAVVLDTWTVSAVLLRAFVMLGRAPRFDCLRVHPSHDPEHASEVVRSLASMQTPERLLFLLSVASSGSAAAAVRTACAEHGINAPTCFAFYALTPQAPNIDAVCVLDERPQNQTSDCELCNSGASRAVHVDPSLFFARDAPENEIVLPPSLFRSRDPTPGDTGHDPDSFCCRYGDVDDLFFLHHEDTRGEHHAFHLNAGPLVANPKFLGRLEALASAIPKPDLILVRDDPVCLNLAKAISERFGGVPLERAPCRPVATCAKVLLVEDQVISGKRLHRAMRTLRDPAWTSLREVNFVVGIARTLSGKEWRRIKNGIVAAGQDWAVGVHDVERFFLPNWKSNACPWCHEFRFLERLTRTLPEAKSLEHRAGLLAERERGIRDEPFFVSAATSSRPLDAHSFVGPAGMSPMATLFTVAAAVQRLRTKEDQPLQPGFPVFNVLASRVYEHNYDEALIQACMFRSVTREEMGIEAKRKISPRLAELFADADRHPFVGELVLAAHRGQVDQSALAGLDNVLSTTFPDVASHILALFPRRT